MEVLGMTATGIDSGFWENRRVFLTGHSGFKGAWLHAWLLSMGAQVRGYSLSASNPLAFALAFDRETGATSTAEDIRDSVALSLALKQFQPDTVFHLAAQPLVRASYVDPLGTYSTNVMGTANLLEAVRWCESVKSVVVVTTDKCYANQEWAWAYRESDTLGGHDPYSNSKACTELVVDSFRKSFFETMASGPRVATARAGNVIGPGDWSIDRLIPDAVRAFSIGNALRLRCPSSVRPWQHVLEPLAGYLMLAQHLHEAEQLKTFAFNFGPRSDRPVSVGEIATIAAARWGNGAKVELGADVAATHEAGQLQLDSSLARIQLGWNATWQPEEALTLTVDGYKAQLDGREPRQIVMDQIADYLRRVKST